MRFISAKDRVQQPRVLYVRPQQRHAIPEIAVSVSITGFGGRGPADLQIGIFVRGNNRPFWSAAAIGIARFCHARPVAGYLALHGEVGRGRSVLPLPGE